MTVSGEINKSQQKDFVAVESKLQILLNSNENLLLSDSIRNLIRTLMSTLIENRLNRTPDGLQTVSILPDDILLNYFKNYPWSDAKGVNGVKIFLIKTFVSLAAQYPSASGVFLEILANAACKLNPCCKDSYLLTSVLCCIAQIVAKIPPISKEDQLARLDAVLSKELLKGLSFVPSVASGRVFIILSVMRAVEETRSRRCFATNLRKCLITVISKTWQTRLIPKPSADFTFQSPSVRQPFNARASALKATSNKRAHERITTALSDVADSVTELIYGDHEDMTGRRLMGKRRRKNSEELQDPETEVPIHDDAMRLAPDIIDLTSEDVHDLRKMGDMKAYISSWIEFEFTIWEGNCLLDCQLASNILSRVRIWFSKLSPNPMYSFHEGLHADNLVDTFFNDVVVDVTRWAIDANQVIFKDFPVHDIPLIVPSWTGVCAFWTIGTTTQESRKLLILKNETFKTRFSVLKVFILSTCHGLSSNIEISLDYLVSKIEKCFTTVEGSLGQCDCYFSSPKGSDYFSFLSIFEFVVQLLSHLSSNLLGWDVVSKNLKRLTALALSLKRRVTEGDEIVIKNTANSECGTPTEETPFINAFKHTAYDDSRKNSMYALVTLCSGIGYAFTQRYHSAESISLLQCGAQWDVSGDVSALFAHAAVSGQNLQHHVVESECLPAEACTAVLQSKSLLISHPAILIVMNVFFMPHIGSRDFDKPPMLIHCTNVSQAAVDPSSDFSVLNLSKILDLLPSGRSAVDQYFVLSNSTILPNLHNLNRADFRRFSKKLAVRFGEGPKKEKVLNRLLESAAGKDLSSFSRDVLVHILSFMSFKRVCRMACVSSGILNASKEESLWEIFYKRKFRNYSFESCVSTHCHLLHERTLNCDQCYKSTSVPSTLSKATRNKPCHYNNRRHSWRALFKVCSTLFYFFLFSFSSIPCSSLRMFPLCRTSLYQPANYCYLIVKETPRS